MSLEKRKAELIDLQYQTVNHPKTCRCELCNQKSLVERVIRWDEEAARAALEDRTDAG